MKTLNQHNNPFAVKLSDRELYSEEIRELVKGAQELISGIALRDHAAEVLIEDSWQDLRYSLGFPQNIYAEISLPLAESALHQAEDEVGGFPGADTSEDDFRLFVDLQLEKAVEILGDLVSATDPNSDQKKMIDLAVSLIPEVEEGIADAESYWQYIEEMKRMTTDQMLHGGARITNENRASSREVWQDN